MGGMVVSAVAQEIDYPTTDGQPMAETDAQGIPLMNSVVGLRDHFRRREDVYVSGNLLIYYEEGNVNASVAPDVFVVVGVPNHARDTYKLWKEGKAPDFVLEITSRSTRARDQTEKRELYERLGVEEYWRYDPTGDYLDPPLSGLCLSGGEYAELGPRRLADGTLALRSRVLGLELRIEGDELRFFDPATGEYVLTLTESNEERQRAEQERQRAEQERQCAEQERQRVEAERDSAQARLAREAAARRAAEARVAELEALLSRRREDV